MNTIRMVFSLATIKDWKIHQMDVKCAFWQGETNEEVYVEQPQSYEKKERKDMCVS